MEEWKSSKRRYSARQVIYFIQIFMNRCYFVFSFTVLTMIINSWFKFVIRKCAIWRCIETQVFFADQVNRSQSLLKKRIVCIWHFQINTQHAQLSRPDHVPGDADVIFQENILLHESLQHRDWSIKCINLLSPGRETSRTTHCTKNA